MSEPDVLDQLVPPAWTGRRRVAVASVMLVALAAGSAIWWSGLLGPNLGPVTGYGWGPAAPLDELDGSGGTVEVQLELDNRGLLDAEIDDVHADFLSGAHLEFDGPVTIPARGSARLHFDLVVDACDRLRAPADPMLTFSGHSGPLPVAGRSLSIDGNNNGPATWDDAPAPGRTSWWYLLAQPVCDPEALAP